MKVIADKDQRVPIKMWTDGVPVEDSAIQQLKNVAKMPLIFKWVVAMPDVHCGMGATIGSVIPTQGAIIPAAVGVDIGCGMDAVCTDLVDWNLPDDLQGLHDAICQAVPHGRTGHGKRGRDKGGWTGELPEDVQRVWDESLKSRFADIAAKHQAILKSNNDCHLGTLGTGNHFIEVCLDLEDRVWIMLHSGSRGVGNKIGTYFIKKAKEEMARWFVSLPDMDLAYLPEGTELFKDYLTAVRWAQDFASWNRKIMMERVLTALGGVLGRDVGTMDLTVSCHHNYVARENHYGQNVWVTRKGAVRAREGDMGIIPGSMGARSFIVRGKGNVESFHSCSHGAGRAMSRTEAKRRFSVEDHVAATENIVCKKDASVLDETPGAYKDLDAVMAAQADLVEVLHVLRQVVCVKG